MIRNSAHKSKLWRTLKFDSSYIQISREEGGIIEVTSLVDNQLLLSIEGKIAMDPTSAPGIKDKTGVSNMVIRFSAWVGGVLQTIRIIYTWQEGITPTNEFMLTSASESEESTKIKRIDYKYSKDNKEVHHILEISSTLKIINIRKPPPVIKAPIFEIVPSDVQMGAILRQSLAKRNTIRILSDLAYNMGNDRMIEIVSLIGEKIGDEPLTCIVNEPVGIISSFIGPSGREIHAKTLAALFIFVSISTGQIKDDNIEELSWMPFREPVETLDMPIYAYKAIANAFGIEMEALRLFEKTETLKQKSEILEHFLPLADGGVIARFEKGDHGKVFMIKSKNDIEAAFKSGLIPTGEILAKLRIIELNNEKDLEVLSATKKPFMACYVYEKDGEIKKFWREVDPILQVHSNTFFLPDKLTEVSCRFNRQVMGYYDRVEAQFEAFKNVVILKDQEDHKIFKYIETLSMLNVLAEQGFSYTQLVLRLPNVDKLPDYIRTLTHEELLLV